MSSQPKKALVVGGGIAGPVTAFWLARGGWDVVMIDRAKTRSFYGQGVDITGAAVEVVRKMRVMDKIKARCTGEQGFALCRDNGSIIAALGVSGTEKNKGTTLTREIEIMRGDLADVFTTEIEAMSDRVTVRYNSTITEIRQHDHGVTAVLSDSEKPEEYDIIIGADGVRSATRQLSFPPEITQDCLKPVGITIAFFDGPGQEGDYPYARWQNAPGGRSILVRPVTEKRTSIYSVIAKPPREIDGVIDKPRDEQRRILKEKFSDVQGLGNRVTLEIESSDNFYLDNLRQVKLPTWSSGRVALVGDAAHCPTPLTGKGTTLAITGAYILAGELSETPEDFAGAFERYHAKMKNHAAELQTIPLGGYAPFLLNPQSRLAIAIFRGFFRLVAWSRIWKLGDLFDGDTKFKVPVYSNAFA